jgi:hypothetical protein
MHYLAFESLKRVKEFEEDEVRQNVLGKIYSNVYDFLDQNFDVGYESFNRVLFEASVEELVEDPCTI